VLLACVIALGTLGFRSIEQHTWIDSLFMTVMTISTVGFPETRPLSALGRLFMIGLVFAGLGVILYTVGAVARYVIEGEFQQYVGRRRMEMQISDLTGHHIVCGYGRIGEAICEELAAKPAPFVVVDNNDERLEQARSRRYLVVSGDATDETTLRQAGVPKAKSLIASLSTDAANVFVTLTAKEINPAIFVVARAEHERSQRTLNHAGADQVISPYVIGGHRMAQAALERASS
jgi:voltage-gated potassium channel